VPASPGVPAAPSTFAALGVAPDILPLLRARGIEDPFPIQAATIPPALRGRDVTGRAPTGSGKTLAFGLPIVALTPRAQARRPRALVLVPTRELAAQIVAELAPLGAPRGLRFQAIYGGVGFEPQLRALRRGVDVVVACPGRLADLVAQGAVELGDVQLVVVDEADRMADMGFLPEVRRLLDATRPQRQTLLFSATLDGDVDVLVRRYQRDPDRHAVTPPEAGPVDHELWLVEDAERTERSAELLARRGPALVFTRTRHGADRLAKRLDRVGVATAALHGGRSQSQRDRALAAFRDGQVQALVATDVAARGVHVEGIACVLHYDLPGDAKDYIHRSGRTGRAGAGGLVVSLATAAQRKDAEAVLRQAHVAPLVTRRGPELAVHLAGLPAEGVRAPVAARAATPPPTTSVRPAARSARPAREASLKSATQDSTRGRRRPDRRSGWQGPNGSGATSLEPVRTAPGREAQPTAAREAPTRQGGPRGGARSSSPRRTPSARRPSGRPGAPRARRRGPAAP
jgi:superfamily II DNA/RNA helicase